MTIFTDCSLAELLHDSVSIFNIHAAGKIWYPFYCAQDIASKIIVGNRQQVTHNWE